MPLGGRERTSDAGGEAGGRRSSAFDLDAHDIDVHGTVPMRECPVQSARRRLSDADIMPMSVLPLREGSEGTVSPQLSAGVTPRANMSPGASGRSSLRFKSGVRPNLGDTPVVDGFLQVPDPVGRMDTVRSEHLRMIRRPPSNRVLSPRLSSRRINLLSPTTDVRRGSDTKSDGLALAASTLRLGRLLETRGRISDRELDDMSDLLGFLDLDDEDYVDCEDEVQVKALLYLLSREVKESYANRGFPIFLLFLLLFSSAFGVSFLTAQDLHKIETTQAMKQNLMLTEQFRALATPADIYAWIGLVADNMWEFGLDNDTIQSYKDSNAASVSRRASELRAGTASGGGGSASSVFLKANAGAYYALHQNIPLLWVVLRLHRIDRVTECLALDQAGPIPDSLRELYDNRCFGGYSRGELNATLYRENNTDPVGPWANETSDAFVTDAVKAAQGERLPELLHTHTTQRDYTGSGDQFTLLLPFSLNHTQVTEVLEDLKANDWVDAATRLVVLETLLFNPTYGDYVQVLYTIEMTASGQVNTMPSVKVFWLLLFDSPGQVYTFLVDCLTLLYVLWLVRDLYQHIRTNLSMRLEVVTFWELVTIGHAAILAVYVCHRLTLWAQGGVAEGLNGAELYSNLSSYNRSFHRSRDFGITALFLSWLRVLEFLQYNKRLSAVSETIRLGSDDLISLSVIVGFVLMGFALVGNAIYGFHQQEFQTLEDSLSFLVRVMISSDMAVWNDLHELEPLWTPLYILSFFLLSWLVLLNIVLGILAQGFAVASQSSESTSWGFKSIKADVVSFWHEISATFGAREDGDDSSSDSDSVLNVTGGTEHTAKTNPPRVTSRRKDVDAMTEPQSDRTGVENAERRDSGSSIRTGSAKFHDQSGKTIPEAGSVGGSSKKDGLGDKVGEDNLVGCSTVCCRGRKYVSQRVGSIRALLNVLKEKEEEFHNSEQRKVDEGLKFKWQVRPFRMREVNMTYSEIIKTPGWCLGKHDTSLCFRRAQQVAGETFSDAEQKKKDTQNAVVTAVDKLSRRLRRQYINNARELEVSLLIRVEEALSVSDKRVAEELGKKAEEMEGKTTQIVEATRVDLIGRVEEVDDGLGRAKRDMLCAVNALGEEQEEKIECAVEKTAEVVGAARDQLVTSVDTTQQQRDSLVTGLLRDGEGRLQGELQAVQEVLESSPGSPVVSVQRTGTGVGGGNVEQARMIAMMDMRERALVKRERDAKRKALELQEALTKLQRREAALAQQLSDAEALRQGILRRNDALSRRATALEAKDDAIKQVAAQVDEALSSPIGSPMGSRSSPLKGAGWFRQSTEPFPRKTGEMDEAEDSIRGDSAFADSGRRTDGVEHSGSDRQPQSR
eukprot:Hpha_TRINITY_DN15508_c2_g1::TRINITY_DN15508_c2_g1_i1::g.106748::m.106748